MALVKGPLMSGGVTILIVIFYLFTIFHVGRMRGKHHVVAPACSGPPEFERSFRVQMNTLEQMAVLLPLLWVATVFPWAPAPVVPAIGLIWVIGRALYMQSYMADPAKRGPGMGICMLCNLALLILATGGVIRGWMAVSFIS